MNPIRRYRIWRMNRRIERLLSDAGLPKGTHHVFSGNVHLTEAVYALPRQSDKGGRLIDEALRSFDQ